MPSELIEETPFNFRQANVADLDLLLTKTLELHQHEDTGLLPHAEHFESKLRSWLEHCLGDTNYLFILAYDGQTFAGFVGLTSVINDNGFLKYPLKGLIQLLWVEPEFRGLGIAGQLLRMAESCLKDIGVGFIEVNYTASNQLAQSFWQKSGYSPYATTVVKLLS